jgi:Tfp pilus assembly pilus retraction ATPase PilT
MVCGMAGMYSLKDLLNLVDREGAEELQLEPGRPPVMVLQGRRRVVDGMLVTSQALTELLRGIATEEQTHELDRCGTLQFAFAAPNSTRFNVRVATLGQSLTLTIRNLGR